MRSSKAISVGAALLLLSFAVATGPASAATPKRQTAADAAAKSAGCESCHAGIEPMHASPAVKLGCTDCHGGDAGPSAAGASPGDEAYEEAKRAAHIAPRFPERWADEDGNSMSRNPVRSYTLLNHESPEFIRFFNPGDLRAAKQSCGTEGCHPAEVLKVQKSIMTTTAMLWGGAAYNNGILSVKNYILGESYSSDGTPQKVNTVPPPTQEEMDRGVLPFLVPLPRWNVVQPPDPVRAFERGGLVDRSAVSEVANPNIGFFLEAPGRPDNKLSSRGLGTELRTSAGVLNLHQMRLNDPVHSFLGTNDHPGDFRSSGCTGCHVVYANDRNPTNAGPWAKYGNDGRYHGKDPTIPKDEEGHPIEHRLTKAIPSSQCIVCHMHQPNSFVNTYLGYQWWDYETDGDLMWPDTQRYPTALEPFPFNNFEAAPISESWQANPAGPVARGLWNDEEFLRKTSELPTKDTKFADYHGHGWIFRAVFWQDREGTLLDDGGNSIAWDDPKKLDKAVHLMDIHAEKGMHCVDCHFEQDVHGDGKLYGAVPQAVEIGCRDCHGSIDGRAKLATTGPAAPPGGHNLAAGRTPFGQRRFEWVGNKLIQRSMMEPELSWEVSQVLDSIDPGHSDYNPKSARAKTMQRDGTTWGSLPEDSDKLAHSDDDLYCYTCHTSWVTSCFGCHLPQDANWKKYMQHFEGGEFRNWNTYNPQVVRYDAFMLAKHSDFKGNKIAPARSSSALMISTTNANRERLYIQQMPVSAEGYSSQAFNPHFGHTVRKEQSQDCTSCHLSAENDNNAWLSQVFLLGTNFVNFVGRFLWVGMGEDGVVGVAVTEWDEPQAVMGSNLHRLAYPEEFRHHQANDLVLEEAHGHPASDALSLQLRGEYLYTANGSDGLRVFDVANIDNKGFSERFVTAPVSPLGQRAYVHTEFATGVALPTNMNIEYGREQNPANREQPMHPVYKYAYVADRYEGLVVVDVNMLADRDPRNNFLERVADFNPDGILDGARYITVAGNYAYITANAGLVVVSIDDPLSPSVVAKIGTPELVEPFAVAIQFRYAFVTDREGLKVIDVTNPAAPRLAGRFALDEAKDLYVARTYAYVANGSKGLAIVNVENPEKPQLFEMYNAEGRLTDTHSVRVGSTHNSVFAYVADGVNGVAVIQLISPGTTPGAQGFSPRPTPLLVATYPTSGPAITLSKGYDRDRAVDESGNQVSVFGRLGSRPFTRDEMEALFMQDNEIFRVSDEATNKPGPFVRPLEPQPGVDPDAPQVRPEAAQEDRLLPGRL